MSYKELYDAVQSIKGRISTRWLRDEAIRMSSVAAVKEQWTGVIDGRVIRGFYIEGPQGSPVPLAEHESLIVLLRSLDKAMRRFVYTKELLHIFDADEEKADTPAKFDLQIERFRNPAAEPCPQFQAETKAFWRALSLLCQEERRLEYKDAIVAGRMSVEVVAAALQIPSAYARNLFREDFLDIVRDIM